jgi:hypothetical protein
MMEHQMAQRNRAFSRAGIQVTHPDAAAVDVGGATHYAAVRPDIDDPVRNFNCFTADLNAMADWFEACGAPRVRIVVGAPGDRQGVSGASPLR